MKIEGARFTNVRSQELSRINLRMKAGGITLGLARRLVEQIRTQLYIRDGAKLIAVVFNSENRKLLESYWASEYEPRLISLVDNRTARTELERAIDAVGTLALQTSDKASLQAAVNKIQPPRKQRRLVARLNVLLRYAGRDFKLFKARKQRMPINYLTIQELERLFQKIEDPKVRIACEVALATGARLGELFALELRHYNQSVNTIKILSQIDRYGTRRATKNHKQRTAFVLPRFRAQVLRWFDVKDTINRTSASKFAGTLRRCSKKLFGKPLVFHDLRHCYAVYLLSIGTPLSQVAQCLGDSNSVAEEYYIGFDLSANAIEMINKLSYEGED